MLYTKQRTLLAAIIKKWLRLHVSRASVIYNRSRFSTNESYFLLLLQFHWSIRTKTVYPCICMEKKIRVKLPTFNALLRRCITCFPKHFDVSVTLGKYFAHAVIALIYSKTTIRGFKSQPVPGPFSFPLKGRLYKIIRSPCMYVVK